MPSLRTNAAAELLGVSPNTLRSWERRFGYPRPRRTEGGHRQYDLGELEALRRALLETNNIAAAIERAGGGPRRQTLPAATAKQVNVRVSPQAFEVLEAAVFLKDLRSLQELLGPLIEAEAERLARDPHIRSALELRRRSVSTAQGRTGAAA